MLLLCDEEDVEDEDDNEASAAVTLFCYGGSGEGNAQTPLLQL